MKIWELSDFTFFFGRESISDCTGFKYHDSTQKKLNKNNDQDIPERRRKISSGGGKSRKTSYLTTWVLLHYSPLLLARTPTFDCVYQIWYGFIAFSITRSGGMDDKLWTSWQNSHSCLVANRLTHFFHARVVGYTLPPLYKPWGVSIWTKMIKICSF